MLITSHLAVTFLVGRSIGVAGPELLISLLGGVALDTDHLLVNDKWKNDLRNFLQKSVLTHGEIKQHSWIQEPLFGLSVGVIFGILVSFLIPSVRWWVFPLFQGLHIFMDAFMSYEHQPFVPFKNWSYRGWVRSNSGVELISSSLVLAVLWLL